MKKRLPRKLKKNYKKFFHNLNLLRSSFEMYVCTGMANTINEEHVITNNQSQIFEHQPIKLDSKRIGTQLKKVGRMYEN